MPARLRGTSSGNLYVSVADWYTTLCSLAQVDPSDNVFLAGKIRAVDGVNVWPMLTQAPGWKSTARRFMPTTESSLIDTLSPEGFKLVNLAGASRYYQTDQTAIDPADPQTTGHLPCLASHQPAPAGPIDSLINCVNVTGEGPGTGKIVGCCAVCSVSQPCLFALNTDPGETTNIAPQHPSVVNHLSALLMQAVPYGNQPGNFSSSKEDLWPLDPAILAQMYTKVDPSEHWKNFSGPCYVRK